jgi:hypothetical protein
VVQDGFNKTICFRDSKQVLGCYSTIDSVFVITTALASPQNPAFAVIKRQPKVDFTTMHRRLLHCSQDKVITVAQTLGITYSPAEYSNFDWDVCNASKAKNQVSRGANLPVEHPLYEVHADTIHHTKLGFQNFKYSTHILDTCTGYY